MRHRVRATLWIATLLAALSAAPAARALDFRAMGGMGLTIWPMELRLSERAHPGVGLGISGRVMAQLGFVRLQAGLLQGEFEEDDRSILKRSYIFGGIEGVAPLPADLYLTLGARLGGSHLVLAETLDSGEDNTRRVRDFDIWSPLAQPIAALGWLLLDKFHIELELGLPLDYLNGGMHVSYTVLIGVYFKMGGG